MTLNEFLRDYFAYSDDLMYVLYVKDSSTRQIWSGKSFKNIPQVFLDWPFDRVCFGTDDHDVETVYLFVNPPEKSEPTPTTQIEKDINSLNGLSLAIEMGCMTWCRGYLKALDRAIKLLENENVEEETVR